MTPLRQKFYNINQQLNKQIGKIIAKNNLIIKGTSKTIIPSYMEPIRPKFIKKGLLEDITCSSAPYYERSKFKSNKLQPNLKYIRIVPKVGYHRNLNQADLEDT